MEPNLNLKKKEPTKPKQPKERSLPLTSKTTTVLPEIPSVSNSKETPPVVQKRSRVSSPVEVTMQITNLSKELFEIKGEVD